MATVPGRYLWGFMTLLVEGADLRAALVASCFLGAAPPVDLRAFCFVRAMAKVPVLNSGVNLYLASASHPVSDSQDKGRNAACEAH
jgi:hypothetical protein